MWANTPWFCPSNYCIRMPPIKNVDSSRVSQASPENKTDRSMPDRQVDETIDRHSDDTARRGPGGRGERGDKGPARSIAGQVQGVQGELGRWRLSRADGVVPG